MVAKYQVRTKTLLKFIAGGAFGLILLLALVSPALAYDPHGSYSANTDACAWCHSTHTAQTPNLLGGAIGSTTGDSAITLYPSNNPNATYKICMYCHDGNGSKYDELNGRIIQSDGGGGAKYWTTPAGGFSSMPDIAGDSSYATQAAVTSTHQVAAADGVLVSIPGGNQTSSDTAKVQMTCSSCHDPHLPANDHAVSNDRMLKAVIKVLDTDNVTVKSYVTTGVTISVTTGDTTSAETVTYSDNINNFCSACHTDYLAADAQPSGTYTTGLYRHPVGVSASANNPYYNGNYLALPLSVTGKITCLTCHYGHGTTASVAASTFSGGSTLLRMDERGVCQNCHRQTPSLTPPNAVSAALAPGNKTKLIVTFNTYMFTTSDSAGALFANSTTNPANYSVTLDGTPVVLSANSVSLAPGGQLGKTVVISLPGAPTTDNNSVTITNVQDLNAAVIPSPGVTLNFIH